VSAAPMTPVRLDHIVDQAFERAKAEQRCEVGAVSGRKEDRARAAYRSRDVWAKRQGFDLDDYWLGRERRPALAGGIYRRFYGPDAARLAGHDEVTG
jgi:hypothetical protein